MVEKKVTVLVIEDDASLRRVLRKVLVRQGFNTLEAADGETGLGLFMEKRPPVVVTDVRLPDMDGLEVLRRIKEASPETFVVISTGSGSESLAAEALRHGASNFLVKPYSIHEFAHAVGILADLSLQRPEQELTREGLEGEKRVFVVDSGMDRVNSLVRELTRTVSCFDTDIEAVRVGLLEMITNAVEHGSLKISREEKAQAIREGSLADLYRERAADETCRGCKVTVEADINPRRAAFTVRDEGEGFDCRILPDPESSVAFTSGGGRGILLTLLCMDEVTYNEKGNEVTIVKLLGSPKKSSSPTAPGGSGSTSPTRRS